MIIARPGWEVQTRSVASVRGWRGIPVAPPGWVSALVGDRSIRSQTLEAARVTNVPATRGQRERELISMCPASSDEDLMERLRRDDVSALGELFDRHRPSLFAFILRLVGDWALAEDLAQEVFWRLWERRASFDSRRRFSTWIYVIARRMVWDALKSGQHRTTRMSELSEAEQRQLEVLSAASAARPPEELMLQATEWEQVQAGLRALPFQQRVSVLLREYEGRSHREIGEILGCSEGKARVVFHRARRALRALLSPLLESEEKPCDIR
jgi:RNA polymerase sigma factor (sigma-70 family)